MKTIKFTALLLAITAMVSCQKENIDTTYNSDPSAVKLTATVGSPFTRSNPLADGTESAAFNTGDVVSVSAEGQDEVRYTLSGTTWSPESGKYLKWNTATMTFNAYYPVGVNGASMSNFDLPGDQRNLTNLEQADYMTFSDPIAKPTTIGEAVSFSFTRKMARVIVNITFNDQYNATDYTVSNIAVFGNTDGYAAGAVRSRTTSVAAYTHTDGKFYALMSPTTTDNSADFLHIFVTKREDNTDDNLTVKGIPAHEAGKSYTYNVKVGKNKVEITNITVEDWNTGTVIPGGEAKILVEVDPSTHTLTVNKEGALKAQDITDALDGGTILNVAGKVSNADMATISAYSSPATITVLNLVKADLSTVTTANFTARTSLAKVLCTESQSTAVSWSLASGTKHLYTGKNYGNYTTPLGSQTLPCYVLSVADNGGDYKLVYRGTDTKNWQTANTYCQGLGGHLISYDNEADFICNSPTFQSLFYQAGYYYWTDKYHGTFPIDDVYYKTIWCQNSTIVLYGGKSGTSAFYFLLVFDITD